MSFNNFGVLLKATAFKPKSFDCNWSSIILRSGTTATIEAMIEKFFDILYKALIYNGFPETSGKNGHYIFSRQERFYC